MPDNAKWFRVAHLQADGLTDRYDALDQVRAGDLQAVVVAGVYPTDVLERATTRLEQDESRFLKSWFPKDFNAFFYGINLTNEQPNPKEYFRAARMLETQMTSLFSPVGPPSSTISTVLSALDNGRFYQPAPGRIGDESYMFATIRAHLDGGHIPPHFDARPLSSHLRSIASPHVMSYVLMIRPSTAGGALQVFDLERRVQNGVETTLTADVQGLDSITIDLDPGSMIIFDSARYLHRVQPARGPNRRWTLCSFFAPAISDRSVLCWG